VTDTTARELSRTHTFILAGGKGERLHPLTASRPKPTVPFGGSFRIIDFTLSNCLKSGLARVAVLTQHRYKQIHRHVRQTWCDLWDRTPGGYIACYPPTTGKRYKGTADAICHNFGLVDVHSDSVLVLAGDHVYDMDYRDLLRQHIETGAEVTISTVECPLSYASAFGVVQVNEALRVIGFEEKPRTPHPLPSNPSKALVSMGIYVFRRVVLLAALREICDSGLGFDFGHDIIPHLIHSARVYAYDFRDGINNAPRYWRDIGTIDAYYAASMDLVQASAPFDPYASRYWPLDCRPHLSGRHIVPPGMNPAWLHGSALIERSVLSSGVHVEANAVVEESVLMPGVHVGRGARVRRAIVEEGMKIPDGVSIGLDPANDRNHYMLTESGIVVISPLQSSSKAAVYFQTKALRETNRTPGPVKTAAF
jgi:glucose-1-phosphate adenylyltransferase